MKTVLHSFAPVMRRIAALMLGLLIVFAAPATAFAGFCAKMPCCVDDAGGDAATTMSRPDCCNSISCDESPEQKLGPSTTIMKLAGAFHSAHATPASLSVVPSLQQAIGHDLSPPPTSQQRLSTLSLLLI